VDIETPRLLLRHWRTEDFEPFARMNQDPWVMRYFPAVLPFEESREKAERSAQVMDERGWGCWAVELKAEADFIGFIALAEPSFEAHFTPCVEIGWRLAWAFLRTESEIRTTVRKEFGEVFDPSPAGGPTVEPSPCEEFRSCRCWSPVPRSPPPPNGSSA
jgi:hypothetical protein